MELDVGFAKKKLTMAEVSEYTATKVYSKSNTMRPSLQPCTPGLCHMTLVLSTLVHSAVWLPSCHKPLMNTQQTSNTRSQIPDSCPWWIAVFLNTKWLLFLQKYEVLVMENRGLLIFSTAHKLQISMSPDHIVLECLNLKIVWTAEIEVWEKLLSNFFSWY